MNYNLTPTAEVGWDTEPAPENWGGVRNLTLSEQIQEKQQD
jgi:hypothetical protein